MGLTGDIESRAVLQGELNALNRIDAEMSPVAELEGELSDGVRIEGDLSVVCGLSGALSNPVEMSVSDYEGPYLFTPSMEAQRIDIGHKTAAQDIIISPIPSNYGLITWNGATLTVS